MYWYAVYTFPVYTVQTRYARRLHTHVLRSPSGHHRINYNSLSVTIQPIPSAQTALSIKSVSLQCGDQMSCRTLSNLSQVHVDDVSCSSFIHWFGNFITEGHQVFQACLAMGEALLVNSNHLNCFPGASEGPSGWPAPWPRQAQRWDWVAFRSLHLLIVPFWKWSYVSNFPISGNFTRLPWPFKYDG